MTTMPAAVACSTVPAETPSPSAETTAVSESGPRLLAITTERPARERGPRHRLPEAAGADDSDAVAVRWFHYGSFLEFGREQVAHGKASIRSPALRELGPSRPRLEGGRARRPVRPRAAARGRRRAGRRAGRERRVRKPCAVHGPMPGTSVRAASTSSSVMRENVVVAQASVDEPLRERPQRCALASRHPAGAKFLGSAASSSAGDGRCPPKRCWRRPRIVRVALTDSCWPTTWKMSVPNASSGGSSSIHARGWKSGCASISLRENRIRVAQELARLRGRRQWLRRRLRCLGLISQAAFGKT